MRNRTMPLARVHRLPKSTCPSSPIARGLRSTALAGLLVLAACRPAPQSSETLPAGGEWREFQGTWTAAVIADPREAPGVRVRRGGVIFHDATGVDENVIARAPKTIPRAVTGRRGHF